MARAHRLALLTSFFTTLYLLAYFTIVPVPLVDAEVVQQVLPYVSLPGVQENLANTKRNTVTDPMVAVGFVRLVFSRISGAGVVYV